MRTRWAIGLFLAVAAWAADTQPQVPCSVSGNVVNAVTGEPLKKAQLTLSDTASENSYAGSSEENGAFCLVVPGGGHYELVIQRGGFVRSGQTLTLDAGQPVTGKVIRMVPQGVIVGQVRDRDGDPVSGVAVQAIQARTVASGVRYSVVATDTTNDLGEYRIYGLNPDRYLVGGAYRSEFGYAAVYYPNVQEANRAVPVSVAAGAEMRGVNLTITESRNMRLRGVVHSPNGSARGISVIAAPCDAGPLNRATTTVQKPDGSFELRDLTPGCYILAADSFNGGKRYSARLPISIGAESPEDVSLNLAPPVQLAGTVHMEGGGANAPVSSVIVNLVARFSKLTAGGAPDSDGNLLLNNIVPETYELSVAVPDGYYLKSAKYGEIDAMRSGLDLSHGAGGRLELEIAGDGGQIAGSVTDGDDKPIDGARVALVPEDPIPASRQKLVVTGSSGAFRVRGIAPGNYKVYASRDLQVDALHDPAYLKQLEPQAKSVAIHENGEEILKLKAIGAEAVFAR